MTASQSIAPTFASFYDFYDGPQHRQPQLAMYREFAAQAGPAVLELACGTGIISLQLASAGCQVTGLDISRDMLDVFSAKLASQPPDVRRRAQPLRADSYSMVVTGHRDRSL